MSKLLDQIVGKLWFRECREILGLTENGMHRLAALYLPPGARR